MELISAADMRREADMRADHWQRQVLTILGHPEVQGASLETGHSPRTIANTAKLGGSPRGCAHSPKKAPSYFPLHAPT